MLATYVSAAIIVLGSLVVGRALVRALGREDTTWLEPVAGFAALVVTASLFVRLLDGGTAGAIAVGVLIVAALAYLRGRVLPAAELRVAAAPALITALFASVPLIASLRIGILGVGINNDLASHLLWSEWLTEQNDPEPTSLVDGYPVGAHSLVASLGQAFGFDLTEVMVGLLIAVAVLGALTALALLRDLSPLRRTAGAVLVALPYLVASALSVGGFKETTMGLIVLGFVVALAQLEREYPGDRATGVILGLLGAAALAVYSYPGLYWLLAAAGLLGLMGAVRAMRRGDLGEQLRRAVPVVAVGAAVTMVVGIAELVRANTFRTDSPVTTVTEGDAKLREAVSPLEALGIWPDANFLAGTNGPPAWPLFGAIGLLAIALAVIWWVRRGTLAVPLGVLGGAVIYLGTLAAGGLYVQSKALAVISGLAMLLIVRALFAPAEEPAAGTEARRPAVPWLRPAVGIVFAALAAVSSFLALRDAVVAPNEHADELAAVRERTGGDWVLSLTNDRFTDYQLRTTKVGSPTRNAQRVVPARNGKDFRLPLDFDSVAPETLDYFDWVLVTGAAYRSQPSPNLELVESTDSYELWERVGPTPLNTFVFGEEARPGKVLSCKAADIEIGKRRRGAQEATVFEPPPVIGKRFAWEPGNTLGPGDSATQSLALPPGDWNLSMQYQSPVVDLSVEAAGQEFEVPAAMDGAIPFRLGEGPFWPVGEISSDGGEVEITISADELSTIQRLLGVGRSAAIGNIVATRPDPYASVAFAAACGRYVDHYGLGPPFRDTPGSRGTRKATERALAGRYQPKSPEELAEKKAERQAAGD